MRYAKRRWGWYATLLDRKKFKVKLLHFRSDHSCSMQRHNARSELWLCLYGNGVMDGDVRNAKLVNPGDWILVDCGRWHQFKAREKTLFIEVQFGLRCEEDDIERKNG